MEIQSRPYVMTLPASGNSYPASAEEVRTLAAEYPLVKIGANLLILRADDGQNVRIEPATLGGGPAFTK